MGLLCRPTRRGKSGQDARYREESAVWLGGIRSRHLGGLLSDRLEPRSGAAGCGQSIGQTLHSRSYPPIRFSPRSALLDEYYISRHWLPSPRPCCAAPEPVPRPAKSELRLESMSKSILCWIAIEFMERCRFLAGLVLERTRCRIRSFGRCAEHCIAGDQIRRDARRISAIVCAVSLGAGRCMVAGVAMRAIYSLSRV